MKQTYLDKITIPLNPATAELVYCEPHEVLYCEGQELTHLYFLMSGKTKIYSVSINGDRRIITFNKAIQILGEVEFLQQRPLLHSVEVTQPAHLLRVPAGEFRQLLKEPLVKDFLLNSISHKFYTKSDNFSIHILNDAMVRLASYLLAVTHDGEGVLVTPIVSDVTGIAEFIGTTKRHLNRLILQLVAEGIVCREGRNLRVINSEKLIEKAKHNVYELQ